MGKGKVKVMDSARGYDLAALSYDEREAYLNSFEKKQLLPLLGDVTGKTVLDVGAGTGRVSIPLQQSGARVTALDVSSKMLERLALKNKKIQTVVGEAEALPFEDSSFDIVVSAFLIVHLKDPTRFFDEVYRILKDGGRFLVTNINQKDPPVLKTKEGEIVIESFYHRPEKIRDILESLAFSIKDEVFIKEKEIWVDQIIMAEK